MNILIVEDNPGDARLVCEMLKECRALSFIITCSENLADALELLKKELYDAVLLDINLPDSRGMDGLEKITAQKPDVPVIVFTGTDDENIGLEALQKNAGDYLVKGNINSNLLVRSIRYAIERNRREMELRKLNRTLNALGNSNQAILRETNEREYLNEICKIIVEDCGYRMVWIGFAEEDADKTVRPVASAGFEEQYLDTLSLTWEDSERGRGPTGTAIRTGNPAVCKDIIKDPDFLPWRDEALKRGYASSIVLPLMTQGKTLGAINIYSRLPDSFSQDEIKLLSRLAGNIAYGIRAIRLRDAHAAAEIALKKAHDELEVKVAERTSELLNTQQELLNVKRLSDIGTLAATVAHELRNPLAAINMASHNLKRKTQNPLLEKHFKTIEKKVWESEGIISNLLFYSRIRPPRHENVNVYELLDECIRITESRYPEINVLLERKFDNLKGFTVEADPLQLKEVFSNLVNNAFDALNEHGGKIEIMSVIDGSFVGIRIKDNGQGIDEADLNRIFDPFFTTKAKGTGLGLTVCKQIIGLHGGTIEVESQKNKGAAVTVKLPVKK